MQAAQHEERNARTMKATRRRVLASTVAIAFVALGILAMGANAAPQRGTSNSITFEASPSVDPNAPGISTVVVSNDDSGMLTFQINIPNRPTWTADMAIGLFLDTDQNPATGGADFSGADYWIDLSFNSVDLGSWNGSTFDFSKRSPASLIYSYNNGATIKINSRDLGSGTTGFNFYVAAVSGITGTAENSDDSNAHYDFAPAMGHDDWEFPIKVTPLQLSVSGFGITPKKPKAGQPFTASMIVNATVPGVLAKDAQITCVARVAGKLLQAKARGIANGRASCSWQLPKSAKGKQINGSVVVAIQGLQASKSFSTRVG